MTWSQSPARPHYLTRVHCRVTLHHNPVLSKQSTAVLSYRMVAQIIVVVRKSRLVTQSQPMQISSPDIIIYVLWLVTAITSLEKDIPRDIERSCEINHLEANIPVFLFQTNLPFPFSIRQEGYHHLYLYSTHHPAFRNKISTNIHPKPTLCQALQWPVSNSPQTQCQNFLGKFKKVRKKIIT